MTRELDLQVARARGDKEPSDMYTDLIWEKNQDGTWRGEAVNYEARSVTEIDWPQYYSTNIAAAWELVMEMMAFDFELDYKTGHNEPWVCVAWPNTQFSSFVEGIAKTPQEAICKCYLEWKAS